MKRNKRRSYLDVLNLHPKYMITIAFEIGTTNSTTMRSNMEYTYTTTLTSEGYQATQRASPVELIAMLPSLTFHHSLNHNFEHGTPPSTLLCKKSSPHLELKSIKQCKTNMEKGMRHCSTSSALITLNMTLIHHFSFWTSRHSRIDSLFLTTSMTASTPSSLVHVSMTQPSI